MTSISSWGHARTSRTRTAIRAKKPSSALRRVATSAPSPSLLIELDRLQGDGDPWRIEQALLLLAAKTGDAALFSHVERLRVEWETDRPDQPVPDDLQAAVERCLRP